MTNARGLINGKDVKIRTLGMFEVDGGSSSIIVHQNPYNPLIISMDVAGVSVMLQEAKNVDVIEYF